MKRTGKLGFVLLGGLAAAAIGQTPPAPAVIRVVGHGLVRTPPDMATIAFTIRGEGATSDDAVRALVDRREAIDAALGDKAELRTGRLAIQAARDKACGTDDDDARSRLSTGVCAVKGYVATLHFSARVAAVTDAGTLLGEASRLGATDPSLEDFALLQPAVARKAAVADAIRDARAQAAAIAAASGAALGELRRVEDQRAGESGAGDIVVTAQRRAAQAPAAVIKLAPEPIETRADLIVEFAIVAT